MRDIWEHALVKSKHKGEESPRGSLIGLPTDKSKMFHKAKSKPLDKPVPQVSANSLKKSETVDLQSRLKLHLPRKDKRD